MLKRKIISWILASILMMSITAVMAGGPEVTPPIYSGIYLEGDVGYASIDWRDFGLGPAIFFGGTGSTNTINTQGGFTYGFDLGYEFEDRYFSLEIGWLDLPIARGTQAGVAATAVDGSVYGDAKFSIPVFSDTLYLFSKVGAVYRYTRLTANTTTVFDGTQLPINGRFWTVLFAVGTQYYFLPNWSVHVQYIREPGYYNSIPPFTTILLNVPPANIVTAGIGYKFLF
jgi:opacity protein-like surface antigen